MQDLTASPRDGLTLAQVTAILTSDSVELEPGLELLDSSDSFVADISEDLQTGEVEHQNYSDVHGTIRLTISRTLTWTTDRVRPYLIFTDPDTSLSARFNLGVYLLQTPERAMGDDLQSYDVSGVDKLSLLQSSIVDTYVVEAGATYLGAVTQAIASAGAGSRVKIGGPAILTTLVSPMVWATTDSDHATWLHVVNDLLKKVGYTGMWVDQDGFYRSDPYVSPMTRTPEWELDGDNPSTSLVAEDRTERHDGFDAFNAWRFVSKDAVTTPSDGAGIYDVLNASDGPYSVAALGRLLRKVVYLDAADQASLVSQGDSIVQADRQFARTLEVNTSPLPHAAHFDVISYTDESLGALKTQARSWSLPLDGSDMTWTLEVI